ncbi:hypothetical protein POTOM_045562 [Populus tomentosa]|uniref:Adenylate kinase n=1 Tax=Populus tomentosa TaxID=118781 RepID=A0A8X7YTU3_POPTO|nr:hypothetical protein POTOM_045562 [Populus tomentosa]
MAATSSCSLNLGVKVKGKPEQPFSSSQSCQLLFSSNLSFAYNNTRYCLSLHSHQTLLSACLTKTKKSAFVVASAKPEHLKIMISGAPASGKGTQCELITKKISQLQAELKQLELLHRVICDYLDKQDNSLKFCFEIGYGFCIPLYGLVHIAAGDLLRAEIASGSENGKRAKEYMEKGQLVPNEIVVMMVKDRLLQPDSQENGWLLDGYPRSLSQATALKEFGFRPDLFIVLEVRILVAAGMLSVTFPYLAKKRRIFQTLNIKIEFSPSANFMNTDLQVNEEILVERVVGRRLDPVTGKIYHLKYSPPETEEIAARLTQRFDDTEEKACSELICVHLITSEDSVFFVASVRTLDQYCQVMIFVSLFIWLYLGEVALANSSSKCGGSTFNVNGNVPKEDVFAQIDDALTKLFEDQKLTSGSLAA